MNQVKNWWKRLTLPQAVACVAGLAAMWLMRDRLPHDVDTAKGWIEVLALAAATGGTLLHGSEAAPARASRTAETDPPEAP